ncbi:MAG: hypothetical protein JRJ82_10955 [Deltaproteobacteria bacterium]|nr:hypothetical protein [Deltaproteobacteria bacterium]
MIDTLKKIVAALLKFEKYEDSHPLFDWDSQGGPLSLDPGGLAEALNHAFLITLAGDKHPAFGTAEALINGLAEDPDWSGVARFYQSGPKRIRKELETMCQEDARFAQHLEALADWASSQENLANEEETAEKFWSVFFPEAVGIYGNEEKAIRTLQEKRTVTIKEMNPAPISDPGRQILFSSNVLLTVPDSRSSLDGANLPGHLREKMGGLAGEPQLYWYDHPIHVGVKPESNEILYGLRGLEEAFAHERREGNLGPDTKPTCILSLSATHRGLHALARGYIEEELNRSGGLENMQVYVFTEADTERIREEILAPAASHYLGKEDAASILEVFGVDGEYGRHYSFLKAIAAFWSVLIDSEIKATFKIDLDQVFPQKELEKETDLSAFGHFKTPLWGARGLASNGDSLEMGMIAGALVDEKDACNTIFTPDVPFPDIRLSPDEYFFFSTLPQALSTQVEMMTCYTPERLDGLSECLQRIHVTGGTNGILVDSLRRYRPFTPSFMGRAEDQAYILSVLARPGTKLAYVHKDGLIMRHDKEAFAEEAVASARMGKLVGDYIRIIYFTAYAGALAEDISEVKDAIDPFTGCFVSRIPATVVYLRFAFKAASLFLKEEGDQGLEFVKDGAGRIMKAFRFADSEEGGLNRIYQKERFGWDLYYDILNTLETALENEDVYALELREKSKNIINLSAIAL